MLIAIRFTIITFILCGLIYPLAMTGLAQVLFPQQANGSLIQNQNGQVIGSQLIGQAFTKPEYFHPRPAANNYDAANSGGYNQGTTNKKLVDRVHKETTAYQQLNKPIDVIPPDAITASGSGLDPHISLANALAQTSRVANARNITVDTVRALVLKSTEQSFLGDGPYVNVLQLNLALDKPS